MAKNKSGTGYVKSIAAVSMCTAFIVISSWIAIPFAVNFTLQTFAVFVICLLFDFKISFFSVVIYMMLGVIGVPVFSCFGAGISAVFGPTGGFLVSFLLFPIIINLFNFKSKFAFRILSMTVCMLLCYILGTLWYYFGYGGESVFGILTVCVFPFIIPDIIKIFLAAAVYSRLSKINLMK